jgi:hypothetical protein
MTTHYDVEPDRDETVVVSDRGSALGTILGIIVIAGLLIAIWWFALGPGSTGSSSNDINVNVNVPSQVAPSKAPAS